MPQIPEKCKGLQDKDYLPPWIMIDDIITYLHADKKLRDEQFEAILESFNAAGVVLKDLVDIELENK